MADAGLPDVHSSSRRIVTVALEVQGTRSIAKLAAKLADIPGVIAVNTTDLNVPPARRSHFGAGGRPARAMSVRGKLCRYSKSL
jgi:hypothetical protein